MPISFRIDRARDLVLTDARGSVDVVDIAEHIERLTLTRDRPAREIADFSEQTCLTLDPEVARSAGRALAEIDGGDGGDEGSQLALVAGSYAVFATLRVFGAHRRQGGVEVRVFRERGPALSWLGVAPGFGRA